MVLGAALQALGKASEEQQAPTPMLKGVLLIGEVGWPSGKNGSRVLPERLFLRSSNGCWLDDPEATWP